MRNNKEESRFPAWGDTDNTGKFVYLLVGVLLFLLLSSFWN